jgi:hypothetical protein
VKVAICISGLYRTFNECYPTIKEYIINNNPNIEFDLIASFSIKENIIPEHDSSIFKRIQFIEDSELPDLAYQKDKYTYEVHGHVSNYYQLSGLKQVNELRNQVEQDENIKYDFLLRTRPDIKFLSSVSLNNLDYNKIYLPYGHDHRGGYNDRFAFGNRHFMDAYLNRLDFWMTSHDNIPGYITHAEANLKIYFNALSIQVDRIPFNYCFRRPDQDAEHFIL